MATVTPTHSISRRPLHEELAERLRDLITTGELAQGEKIPELALCQRFGVSRTPLREALKVLASEGSVTLRPNRGSVVSVLTEQEVEEVFSVMGALEALAGEIACRKITDEEIVRIAELHERMVAHWKKRELQPYFRANQAIHVAILDATGNETLKSVYRGLSGRIMATRYLANMSPERWKQAVDEHEEILAAIEARDGKALARILRKHLAQKLETVKEWLALQQEMSSEPA